MTYYKQFAEMLGLELEQEFTLIKPNGEKLDSVNPKIAYRITENGICYQASHGGDWWVEPFKTLDSLLMGEVKAVPKPWKPKYGEQYWSYSVKISATCANVFTGCVDDYAVWKIGNCFRTEEEAQSKGKEIMEKLKKEFEEA